MKILVSKARSGKDFGWVNMWIIIKSEKNQGGENGWKGEVGLLLEFKYY